MVLWRALVTALAAVALRPQAHVSQGDSYKLESDCAQRGNKILQESNPALNQMQALARYNSTTNRCYVRITVAYEDVVNHKMPGEYLYDGQSKQPLAFVSRGRKDDSTRFHGFGCKDGFCVTQNMNACLSGKECNP